MTGPRIDPLIIQKAITTQRWNVLEIGRASCRERV